MTRRTNGPKRRAEVWSKANVQGAFDWEQTQAIRRIAAAAWMAGYRAAARARRKAPKPRRGNGLRDDGRPYGSPAAPPTLRTRSG